MLGRKTYEGLAGYWPSRSGKWADMVNSMPKYVGSSTLSGDLDWNATLLEGDLEDSVPKLKDEVEGDLFMHGSVRMELDDVKRCDSGVVLLTYLPAS